MPLRASPWCPREEGGPCLRPLADALCSVPQHGREEGPSMWKLEQRQGSEAAMVRRGRIRLHCVSASGPQEAGPQGLPCVCPAPPV